MIWILVTVGILTVQWFAVQKKANAPVQEVVVEIIDLKDKKNLLTDKLVLDKCRQHLGYDLEKSKIKELDLRTLETMLKADRRVLSAEVYVDNNEVIHIGILQRQPIVRVQDEDGAYYIDRDGGLVPLHKGAAIRVPVATGSIGKYSSEAIASDKPSKIKDLYHMAKYISEDDFLSSLIEQIDVNEAGEFVLIPKVGKQKLVFGRAENLADRFENLKIFYKEGMPKVGWRKYDKLVLNWEGQVLARKDL